MNRLKRHLMQQSGFSLVELAIIITIAASLAVATITWIMPAAKTDSDKALLTRNKMIAISKAMEAFRVKNARLPCPALPTMAMGLTGHQNTGATNLFDYDDEAMTITSGTGASAAYCPSATGALPTRALGLDSDFMLDGWGRKFFYAVNANFCGDSTVNGCNAKSYSILTTDTAGNNGFTVGYDTTKDLVIKNSAGTTLAAQAAYVVLSYGADGYYAYLQSGSQNAVVSTNSNEVINGNKTADPVTYVQSPATISTTLANRFDDIVLFRTKAQLDSDVTDATTPLIDQATCVKNNQVIGLFTQAIANTMRVDFTALRSGGVGATDMVTTTQTINGVPSLIFSSTSNDAIFSGLAVGTLITTDMPGNTATYTVMSFTVNPSTNTLTVSNNTNTPAIVADAAQAGNVFTSNNGDEVALDILYTVQDACNDYYGTISANDIVITGVNTLAIPAASLATIGYQSTDITTLFPAGVSSQIMISGFTNAANNGVFTVTSAAIGSPDTVTITTNSFSTTAPDASAGQGITIKSYVCPGNALVVGSPAYYNYSTNQCYCPRTGGIWGVGC